MDMKRLVTLVIITCNMLFANAQKCDLPIGVAFSTDSQIIPEAAQRIMTNKLKQALATNNVSGNTAFHQFALVPKFEVINKNIVGGAPVRIVYNLNLTLQIVDSSTEAVFSSYSKDIDAVGENETKAYISAANTISPKAKDILDFIETAQVKIVQYYDRTSDNLIQKAKTLAKMSKYEEALFYIMQIPECCNSYEKAVSAALPIYQKYIDVEGEKLVFKANAIWSAGHNDQAAAEAASLLIEVEPASKAYSQAKALLNEIKAKAAENAPWNYALRVYDDKVSIERQKIEAAKAVGVAFGQGQQPSTTNLLFK